MLRVCTSLRFILYLPMHDEKAAERVVPEESTRDFQPCLVFEIKT